ncbi:CesT family type III secretion system chaperone [Zavarzinella formosa]|uniref:CesT family type III secretion system chaperone n=1 Tax=Zavarzinella formosa TaxID=360055 RepID=UPI0002D3D11B|nr:CesT family type III secretion system chaperone [Zavarzinella formosa]
MKKILLNIAAIIVLGTLAGPVMAQKEAVPEKSPGGLKDLLPEAKAAPAADAKKADTTAYDKLGKMIESSKTLMLAKEQRPGIHTLRVGYKGKWHLDVVPSVNNQWVWIEFPCLTVDASRMKDAKWLADLMNANRQGEIPCFSIDPATNMLALRMAVPLKSLELKDLEDLVDLVTDKADAFRNLWEFPAAGDTAKK